MPTYRRPGPTCTANDPPGKNSPAVDEGTLCRSASPAPQFPPPQDSRGYFRLTLCTEEAGFYLYGKPGTGRAQYAAPTMLGFLHAVSLQWSRTQSVKFGVGDISLADGATFPPHAAHRNGMQVDIRPLRIDGKQEPVRYDSPDYDREKTQILINIIRKQPEVHRVYFNDPEISGASALKGHDNHIHVGLKEIKKPGSLSRED